MPLWQIRSQPGTFSPAQKAAFAKDITSVYSEAGLPNFYVVVVFHDLEVDSFFIGGAPAERFVRISIEHIAVHQPGDETEKGRKTRKGLMDRVDAALAPHIAARGDLKWEHNIIETPRDLWKLNGLYAPPWKSDEEKIWKRENEALPWEAGELKGKL